MMTQPLPLAERIAGTAAHLRAAQRALLRMPVQDFCDFMVLELGQAELYEDFCRKYLPDGDGSQPILEAVSQARKLLWEHTYRGVRTSTPATRARARFTLELLLVRPFLILEQLEQTNLD